MSERTSKPDCQRCGGQLSVFNTRGAGKYVIRSVMCEKCSRRFQTIEVEREEWNEINAELHRLRSYMSTLREILRVKESRE
jgi:transcriptional regulator NrdR family protein